MILVLYALFFLDSLAFVLVLTSVNPYVNALGGSQFFAGAIGSVAALINLIWKPVVGSLSDTVGRKTVLLQCLFLGLIGHLLAAASSSLTLFLIARITSSFGTQLAVLIKSLVDDNIQAEDVKMGILNKMQAFMGICFISGGLVTGIMSEYENGFRYIWLLECLLFTVNIVLVSLFVTNQPRPQKTKPTNKFGEVSRAITNLKKINWPKYWDVFSIKLIVEFITIMFHFNFTYVLMNRFGITGKSFGFVFSSISVMGIVMGLSLPKLKKAIYSDDKSGFRRLFHGCLILTVTVLGGLSSNFVVFFVLMMPFPAARVLFESTFTEVLLARAGAQEKGSVMGAFESTISLAGLTGPLVSGFVSDRWGNNAVFLLCLGPLAVGTGIAYWRRQGVKVEKKKKK